MAGSGDLGMDKEILKGIFGGLGAILVCVLIGAFIASAFSHPPEHVEEGDVTPPVTTRPVDEGETTEAKGNLAPVAGDKEAKQKAAGAEPDDAKLKPEGAKNTPEAGSDKPDDVAKQLEDKAATTP